MHAESPGFKPLLLHHNTHNSVAQWLAYQTSNLGVAGSSPVGVGCVVTRNFPSQAFNTIDVFVIQATTNTLCAHFISLLSTLSLLARSVKW